MSTPHFLLLHNIWYVRQKYPLWYQSMSSTTPAYIRQSIKHHPHHKSILFRERRVDLTMSLLTVYLAGYALIICTPDMHGGNIYRCRNLPVFNDLSEMLPMLSAFGYNVVAPWASWKNLPESVERFKKFEKFSFLVDTLSVCLCTSMHWVCWG